MIALRLRWCAVTRAARFRLALLCLALASGGGFLVLLSPARARTANLESRRGALQREITLTRAAVASLARSRLDGVALQQRLELITQQLPTEREIPPLYRRLFETASSTGLVIALFQPRDVRVQDYFTEIPIALTAEGTYHQVGAFLARVAELPRVMTVGAFKITAMERPAASLRAEMTLATYVYRRAGVPPGPGPTGAKPADPRASLRESAPVVSPRERASPVPAASIVPGSPAPAAPSNLPPSATTESAPAQSRSGYASRGRRDPFVPVAVLAAEVAGTATRYRAVIASASLTGIVRGPNGPLALVEMPGGLGHVLRPGDAIGEARLIRIDGDSVVFDVPGKHGPAGEPIVLILGRGK